MATADAEAILARLVARPAIAGTSNVELIAELAEPLAAAGADVHLVEGTRPDVHLLHAVLGPADAPGGLLLAAHGDVVDVEGQGWSSDPFVLRRAGGRLYGRGTTDMKGFLAAVLAAVACIRRDRLRAPLHVAVSHDEELGCAGIGPLLDRLAGRGIAAPLAGVVVGEPTELTVVERHKGKAALRLRLHGRAAHSSTPAAGVNAVRAAAHAIVALEGLQETLAAEARDEAFAVPYATIGVGPIRGGVALNIVPDACELDVEARVLPGQDVDAVAARIVAVAEAAAGPAGVDVDRLAAYPPLAADRAGAWAARVAESAGRPAGGAVDFGAEAGLYQQRLGCEVVICGPGSMRVAHAADEHIESDQLAAGAALVGRLAEHVLC